MDPRAKSPTDNTRESIKKALLERNCWRGVGRIFDVSLTWLLGFITEVYDGLAADSGGNLQSAGGSDRVSLSTLDTEVDAMWSFVGKKANKQWIWIAMNAKSRQVIALPIGDRSTKSARRLWGKIATVYRENSTFYTDLYEPHSERCLLELCR